MWGMAFAVGEEDFCGVIVDLRVADGAFWVIQEGGDFPGAEVELEEAGTGLIIHGSGGVFGPIAEVGVPVRVAVGVSGGEDDVMEVGQLWRVEGCGEGAWVGGCAGAGL